MYQALDTGMAGASLRDKQHFWHSAIKTFLYELDMTFGDENDFRGTTEHCALGDVHWTRVRSSPIRYKRHNRHCDGRAPWILMCVPLAGETEFEQFGRYARTRPGQFMLEHSDAPYQFGYGRNGDVWAIRIPEAMLQSRARNPDRFCARNFDCSSGLGKFFLDYLGAVAGNIQLQHETARAMVGTQVMDLLAAILEDDDRVLQSSGSSIKAAHLARVEQYLHRNLSDPELSAAKVAQACGISVRYLHLLFSDTGWTLAQWVREHRLQHAYEKLNQAGSRQSVSQLAYSLGFNDHAQFSRAFRDKFGCTPSDVLQRRIPRS